MQADEDRESEDERRCCWLCGVRVSEGPGPVLCGSYECLSAYLREPPTR
ncbi:MAG: hypothetical protein ACRDZ4_04700 [Egibacteraceae bacterium]